MHWFLGASSVLRRSGPSVTRRTVLSTRLSRLLLRHHQRRSPPVGRRKKECPARLGQRLFLTGCHEMSTVSRLPYDQKKTNLFYLLKYDFEICAHAIYVSYMPYMCHTHHLFHRVIRQKYIMYAENAKKNSFILMIYTFCLQINMSTVFVQL